jgi:hypothetical protein
MRAEMCERKDAFGDSQIGIVDAYAASFSHIAFASPSTNLYTTSTAYQDLPTGLCLRELRDDLVELLVVQVVLGAIFRRNVGLEILSVLHGQSLVWLPDCYNRCARERERKKE